MHGNDVAFAAVKESGAVVAWGAAGAGGALGPETALMITEVRLLTLTLTLTLT